MTLDQLRVFVAIAETLHFTNAAKRLNISQSSISAAISALERRHSHRLFDRVGRHVELTEAGQHLLPVAKAILEQVAGAERLLLELNATRHGDLRLSSSQTVASYWLPRHLVALRRAHPTISVSLSVNSTTLTEEAVLCGLAEIGFVEGPTFSPLLKEIEVARDELMVVVAPSHPWAGKPLPPGELASGEWVVRERGAGTRMIFDKYLRDAGIAPESLNVVLELPTNESVRAAVEAGMGATVLATSILASSLDEGLLETVWLPLPARAFKLIYHRERSLTRAAAALLSMLVAENLPVRKKPPAAAP